MIKLYVNKKKSVYSEFNPMSEHITQFVFKSKREHITEVNIPNMAYQKKHFDIEVSNVSRDQFIVSDTVKIMFHYIKSLEKIRSIVKNVVRTLVKERC